MNQNLKQDVTPVIILNWNGFDDTVECMKSVLLMTEASFHVYLVDNGSANQEADKLRKLFGSHSMVTIIANSENKGFTRGNNDVVADMLTQENKPSFIALLNNDTVVSPQWLSALLNSAGAHDADMVSSMMVNYYDRRKIDNLGHFMLNTGEILPLAHGRDKSKYKKSFENLGACGGAALYSTSMIREIGLFDSHFDTGYEDAEFGLRAKLLGYKCIFEPSAVVYHKVSQSINKIKNDRYIQSIQANIFYTYLKLMPTQFLVVNFLFVIIKYMAWFLLGILTFQFKLIKLHSGTLSRFMNDDLKSAIRQRHTFYQKNASKINFRKNLIAPTRFFLLTDLRRIFSRLQKIR